MQWQIQTKFKGGGRHGMPYVFSISSDAHVIMMIYRIAGNFGKH